MQKDTEQPLAAAVGADDLFCCRDSSASRHATDQATVTLRVEAASAAETKSFPKASLARTGSLESSLYQAVTVLVVEIFTFLSYAALIAIIIVKAVTKDALQLFDDTALEQSSVVIGAVCLLFLGKGLFYFVRRVWRTWRLGQSWRPRRKRMAGLAFALGIVQVLNLVFWVVPNAYIIAMFPSCAFFEGVITACGCIRWTCWNSSLLLYLVMGSSLLAWKGPGKGVASCASSGKADAKPSFEPEHYLIGLDAPWWHHLNKLPLWILFQAAILISTANPAVTRLGYELAHSRDSAMAANCPDWFNAEGCYPGPWVLATGIGLVSVSALYFLCYCICMLVVYRQLSQRRFAAVRAQNILFQLQMRTVFLTFKILFISATVLWFYRIDSCLSYFFTWLGMLPMQLIASALAWFTLWQFMPQDSAADPILQIWLQEVAWTEAGMPAQLADRNARAATAQEACLLQSEPMFNFETALKMHKWCKLAYSPFGQQDCSQRWSLDSIAVEPAEPEAGLVKAEVHCCTEAQPAGTAKATSDEAAPSASEDDSPPHAAIIERSTSGAEASTSSCSARWKLPQVQRQSAPCCQPESAASKRKAGQTLEELLAAAMGMYDLTDIQTFWDPQLDTKCVMGWNKQNVVLAFRGTASLTNAVSDLKVWRTVHHSGSSSSREGRRLWHRAPLVHTGFYSAWVSRGLDRQVMDRLKELYDTGAVHRDARVRVTGHSLGGALAMLAAHDIAAELQPPHMQVYTFGCPYLGNHEFARDFSDRVPDTWHLINERDTVTRVGKFLFLFKRPGHRVVVTESGDLLVRPSPLELKVQLQRGSKVRHHWLSSYRAALVASLLAEFSHRGGGQASMARALALADSQVLADDLACDGVDWHKLRRTAQWGSPARVQSSSSQSPSQKCRLDRLCGRPRTHKDGGSRHDSAVCVGGISVASLQQARALARAEEGRASSESLCSSRIGAV